MKSFFSQFSGIIPRPGNDYGLRQLQLTTLGFAVIYTLLHVSLFMDGMVNHVFFACELGTMILYAFLPVKYTVRPASALKRRFYLLVGIATVWLLQPMQLAKFDIAPSGTFSPFALIVAERDHLNAEVAKTLNNVQVEKILQQGGKIEEGFTSQSVYANQMGLLIQALAGTAAMVAFMVVVEAVFVWNRSTKIELGELSSAEKEKNEAQAAKAASKATK
ncbi:hypothetical protein BGZ98_000861 [Dissophora globulifera]|nr:hypothetical protein BGZ98_000861 [Dissophora globulifera]